MNFDWNNIKTNINDLPNYIKSIIKQSEFNINKLLKYDCVNEKDKFLKVLEKDTIEINKIFSLLSLMEILFKNPIINTCIDLLTNYNNKIKTNANLIKKLLYFNNINSKDIEPYQKKFVENIINQLKYNKNNNSDKLFVEGIKFNKINVNIFNLENIILTVKRKERKDIISTYNTAIYNILINTLISRYNEAKYNYNDNYFIYKNKLNNKSFNNLKNFITDLIKTINNELIKKKDEYVTQNFDYDGLLILENNFNIANINLNYFLKKTINFFTEKFQLVFKIENDQNKWNSNVICYDVYKSDKKLGKLYLDLVKDENSNKPRIPIFININNSHYNKMLNINEEGQTCILASYDNFEDKNLTFHMAQKLFIEFMLAVYHLFLYNNFGFSNINIENKNIIELIGEKIFQNEDFIKNFYDNNENIENKINELRLIKLIQFRYLCIDSLFDIGIHLDNSIVNCNPRFIFENTYREINKCYSVDNFNYSNINPKILFKINGDYGGKYYHMIFNEIISHNISKIIINKNLGLELFNTITNIKTDFMSNLKEYLSKYNLINKNIKFILRNSNQELNNETIMTENNYYKEI